MLKINLQFFAHKKGVGSTRNGRDSEAKRLGAKRADGQVVSAGQLIGRVGNTGSSCGNHLHLELRVNGIRQDPIAWLAANGIAIP